MSAPTPNPFFSGVGVVSADNLNTFPQVAYNLAQLRSFTGVQNSVAILLGKIAPNDGGQAFYFYQSSGAYTDNGTSVIVPYYALAGAWLQTNFTSAYTTPTVVNNATLAALPSTFAAQAIRLGYSTAGDSPLILYLSSSSPCTVNTLVGGGDGFSQIPASDGGSWRATAESLLYATPQSAGAKGDGVTDDTASIRIYMTAMGQNEMFFPPGNYVVSASVSGGSIFTLLNPVKIRGVLNGAGPGPGAQDPMGLTQFLLNSQNATLFNVITDYPCIFRDFQVNVTPAFRPMYSGSAILIQGVNTASPVTAGTFTIGATYYIATIGTTNFTTIGASANTIGLSFVATGVGNGTGTALSIATNANTEISNCAFTNVATPINMIRPDWPKIVGCYFDGWSNSAIYLTTSLNIEGSGGHIHDNYFFGTSSTTTSPIYSEVGYTVIDGNEILGGPNGVDFNIKNNPAGFIKITNNTIENFYVFGVVVNSGDGSLASMVMIQNNEFSNFTNPVTASILIKDNTITPAWVQDVVVTGNVSRNTTASGGRHIWIGAGQNVLVANNTIQELGGNTPYGITVGGAATSAGLIAPIQVSDNVMLNIAAVNRYSFSATGLVVLRDVSGVTVANLPSGVRAGSQVFTTDGSPGSSPLTGGSTGSMGFYQNGAWKGF